MSASQQLSGNGDPNGVIDGNPGDTYQDQTGKLWINTAAPSTWGQLSTGSAVFVPGVGAGSGIQNNGSGNAASGVDALSAGQGNTVTGIASSAEGKANVETVTDDVPGHDPACNHLEGQGNTINVEFPGGGSLNHLEGNGNSITATGAAVACDYNHVEGNQNALLAEVVGSCEFNHVEGNQNQLTLQSGVGALSFNHVEGNRNHLLVNGGDLEFCHVEGSGHTFTSTTDDADFSHLEGDSHTVTDADTTHVEGFQHTVSIRGGTANHVEGSGNTVGNGTHTVNFAHVEGRQNTVLPTADAAADNVHVEGTKNSATAKTVHVQGDGAAAIRETQAARASGRFASSGDAQQSALVLRGSTPGAAPNESAELKYGDTANQVFTLEDGKGYVIRVRAISYASDANFMSFEGTFAAHQEGGVVTIAPAPPFTVLQVAGSAGANTWTLTADIGAAPARISFTFTTGVGTTAAVRIACDVEFVEVARA